jgi:hypothetical protein
MVSAAVAGTITGEHRERFPRIRELLRTFTRVRIDARGACAE